MDEHAWIWRFWSDQSGATAIEYGLICGIISTCLLAIASTGGALDVVYDRLNAVIDVFSN